MTTLKLRFQLQPDFHNAKKREKIISTQIELETIDGVVKLHPMQVL